MAWSNYQIILAFTMLITGSINTLATKWADRTSSIGIDGTLRQFDHPYFQACGMFLGEFFCLVVFYLNRIRCGRGETEPLPKFNPLIFWPAALLDMCGTSLMYVGLNMTFASSFQMLRGAIMIFTALLSVAFLGRQIRNHMWFGIFVVLVGLVIVGLADFLFGSEDTSDINGIIAGDEIIVLAQVISAAQMVYEEKFVSKYEVPPLQAVGLEGLFGFLTLAVLQVPFYFINAGSFSKLPEHRLEDALDGFVQLSNSWIICLATVGNIVSIAFFNFAGIGVTKEMSAMTRMVLDSGRTLIIWIVTLALGWQSFFALQVLGFVLLIVGMCVYNDIIFRPLLRKYNLCGYKRELHEYPTDDERRKLINDDLPDYSE
ncbi:solute carrier family 35 member F6-like isoform X2 [Lineus longissimus]|uniref:solute carrier family 35 member F6-like isoform X2 n=1 Tax=Lineus longissimus TaxID=88925 RepID=UPI002B4C5778